VLDLQPFDGSDPVKNHATLERELELHDPRLAATPRILALSKSDLLGVDASAAARASWSERLGPEVPVIVTSAVTGQGVPELGRELLRRVPPLPQPAQPVPGDGAARNGEQLAEHRTYRPRAERAYRVQRVDERSWLVSGAGVDRLVARYDPENEEALAHLERRLEGIGVLRTLREHGFQSGDEVQIGGMAFELHEDV
jgi:GTP-binding protein